ncbi:MAG: hypothetical protein CNIPEHKO_03319 [Anaerolineales bacterium]|nr:DUF4386 family protein [Anaerolineae bacterium]MBV6402997.1 hypothetical protein [Anaerolineales bacterium]MCC7191127.1 DUF4386 family protein [Anaerolineales bacterium]
MQMNRLNLQKAGGNAARINAVLAITTLIVALGLIGPTALADNALLAQIAITNPMPLIIQDALKFMSAIAATVLMVAMSHRLRNESPVLTTLATLFGFLAVICLFVNTGLSLFAVLQASRLTQGQTGMYEIIGALGMAVIVINGLWYLLLNVAALKTGGLPKRLSYLGLVIGGLSLLPPLGIIVLLLSIVWLAWLGKTLSADRQFSM